VGRVCQFVGDVKSLRKRWYNIGWSVMDFNSVV